MSEYEHRKLEAMMSIAISLQNQNRVLCEIKEELRQLRDEHSGKKYTDVDTGDDAK